VSDVVMAHIPMLFIYQHVLNVLLEHILFGIHPCQATPVV
jgi:hypothetical protein